MENFDQYIQDIVDKPTIFLKPAHQDKISHTTSITKKLSDQVHQTSIGKRCHVPELLIEGFDTEQIWQQIFAGQGKSEKYVGEQLNSLLEQDVNLLQAPTDAPKTKATSSTKKLKKLIREEEDILPKKKSKRKLSRNPLKRDALGEEEDFMDDDDTDDDIGNIDMFAESMGDEESEEEDGFAAALTKQGKLISNVDHNDAALGDLEAEMRKKGFKPGDFAEKSDSDEGADAFFSDLPEGGVLGDLPPDEMALDTDEEGDMDDIPEGSEELDEEGQEETYDGGFVDAGKELGKGPPSHRTLLSSDESDNEHKTKSQFENRQEEMKKRIQALEDKAVSTKPWQMSGELQANQRPENALLETHVDFDYAAAPAEPITEESTVTLEYMIKKRIQEQQFDDVVQKELPSSKPLIKPDTEDNLGDMPQKSQRAGLGAAYEQEYLQQTGQITGELDEKTKNKQAEIKKLFHRVCSKLDALSNFVFMPHAPPPQLEVVENVPAVSMEEQTTEAVNTASRLAPEEVYATKSSMMPGETEVTQEERKSKRRSRKRKAKSKNSEDGTLHHSKNERKSKRKKNVPGDVLDSSSAPKSSVDFFSRLQAETESGGIQNTMKKKADAQKSTRKSSTSLKL